MINRTHIEEVALYMRRLEEDKTVKIVFKNLDSIYGLVYKGCNDKYLVIINSNLSYEKQIQTIWHEAKHIYSHFSKKGDIKIFEEEAEEFANAALKVNGEVLLNCKSAY